MTDPLALDPVLSPAERSRLPFNEDLPNDERFDHFVAHVQTGGKIEAGDWMPDEYRQGVLKFVEMHANSELMGVLPEREWIMRAPTLRRKLALTAKVQDEVGHSQFAVPRGRGSWQAARGDDRGPARREDEVPQRLPLPDEELGRYRDHRAGWSTPRRSSPSRRSATRRTRPTPGRCERSAGRNWSTSCTGATSS